MKVPSAKMVVLLFTAVLPFETGLQTNVEEHD
jgi:hypothetical protein